MGKLSAASIGLYGLLKRSFVVFLFFWIFPLDGAGQAPSHIIIPYDYKNVPILNDGKVHSFPIHTGGLSYRIVAEVTVGVSFQHPQPDSLDIVLSSPRNLSSVILQQEGDLNFSVNGSHLQGIFDYPLQPVLGSFFDFAGGDSFQGEWALTITNHNLDFSGVLESWWIEFDMVQTADFEIHNETASLRLQTDGYGCFGDQRWKTWMGAQYQSTPNADFQRTVYHSALYLDDPGIFLSSLDFFACGRLPATNVEKQPDGSWNSSFQIPNYAVSLSQRLIEDATHAFVLYQDFEFRPLHSNSTPPNIIRYINPKMDTADDSASGLKNYVVLQKHDPEHPFIYVFNNIKNATTEKSRYVRIGFESAYMELHGYKSTEWRFENQDSFPYKIIKNGMEIFTNEKKVPTVLRHRIRAMDSMPRWRWGRRRRARAFSITQLLRNGGTPAPARFFM